MARPPISNFFVDECRREHNVFVLLGVHRLRVHGFCRLHGGGRSSQPFAHASRIAIAASTNRSIVDAMKLGDAAKFAAANSAIDSLRARCEVASLERPASLLRCFNADDGELDLVELSRHVMKQADAVENKLNDILLGNPQDNEEVGDDNEETPPKKRRKRKPTLARRSEDGELEAVTLQDCTLAKTKQRNRSSDPLGWWWKVNVVLFNLYLGL